MKCKWCGKAAREVSREDGSIERCVGKRNERGELVTSARSMFYSGHDFCVLEAHEIGRPLKLDE